MPDHAPEEEERSSSCSREDEEECSSVEGDDEEEDDEDEGDEQEDEEEEEASAGGEAGPGPSLETQTVIDVTRRQREDAEKVQRRRTLLKKNQVIAALHFLRRFKMFIKFIAKYQPLLCGKLVDWVIRYETQGRGSLHAHVLWWIEMNPDYIGPRDHVDIPPEVLERFHLYEVERMQTNEEGGDRAEQGEGANERGVNEEGNGSAAAAEEVDAGSEDGPVGGSPGEPAEDAADDPERSGSRGMEEKSLVFDQLKLDFTNGHIWAIKKPENLLTKLNIGMRDGLSMRYEIAPLFDHVTMQ